MHHVKLIVLIVGTLLSCLSPVAFGELSGQSTQGAVAEALPSAGTIDYRRDIRPILSNNCYACHGPDEESREAGLRLDRLESAIGNPTAEHATIFPGSPEKSRLLQRIESKDPVDVMPPPESGKSLTADQIALVRQWIAQGASWEEHWAFVPPRRPSIASEANSKQQRHAIDYFVRRKLRQHGWKPSPEADKETLIRRVTFDLTGLPPTPAEVDAFLADESPEAYQRVVARLLASPSYGEHMARFWLDHARYGDTHGLHLDNYREMWLYRDWVIRAFNENMPYDQFVIEQLAGDLLDDPTVDRLVATGFLRCHVTTNEGGSIEEEVYVRNVVDRVSTTGTVFLGLTLGCAVCHDHKFDPISQKEFYQLFAYFNSLDGPSLDGNVKDPAPVVSVPSEPQTEVLEKLRSQIAEVRSQRDDRLQADLPKFPEWLSERRERMSAGQDDPELELPEGLIVHSDFENVTNDQVANLSDAGMHGRIVGKAELIEGRIGKGFQFGAHNYVDFGNAGSFNDNQSFSYGAWVKAKKGANGAIIAKMDVAGLYKGYDLSVNEGIVSARLTRRRPGYSIKVSTKKQVFQSEKWHHVFVTYDGSKRARGVVIYVDGQQQPTDVFSDSLKYKGGIRNSKPLLLGRRDTEAVFTGATIDDVRMYARRLSDSEVLAVYLSSQIRPLLTEPFQELTDQQINLLRHYYLIKNDSAFIKDTNELDTLVKQLSHEESTVPTTLVFRERERPTDAFVLTRGEYDQYGDQVTRQTPDCLPPMSEGSPRDRLGLARWLVSPEHPLTSRVAVNRFWQQVFGTGLVETSEDFGSQGTPPTHPELLDWLAVEFRKGGWDIKALMKQIVMSATYRQSSFATPSHTADDPRNRLLARGPRFRLDAEMLRDQALAVSGLLVRQVGGPSVKPPQPDGLWEAVGFTSSNTSNFVADRDPSKTHRRSLYTFYKRTSPPPEMTTFDAPSRESTCVRRERTNTPLQALLLLNDPQYVEASKALARQVLERNLRAPADRAGYLYRRCTGRLATQETIEELVQLYDDQLQKYRKDKNAAEALLGQDGEAARQGNASDLAAWTVVSNLLLNLDEVVNKN